jgi:hypothetical protein
VSYSHSLEREGRIAVITFTDPFTFEDLKESATQMNSEVLDKATRLVHSINDFSAVTRLPSNVLSGSLKLYKTTHPNSGVAVIVVSNAFISSLVGVYNKVSRTTVPNFLTLEDALVYLDRLLAEETAADTTPTDS